ncbi:2Fe-2S iron-sulfur cluster-binding protein [Streptomyces sp. Root1310]|uniref:2Fe-2S iron-sulfur cluster-binding protein n=1 Tax=Streptomyces sp. Root1310 TaxID=1736452 RepID=UPI0007088D20|nr:2Fe-2S iron-sulfur cluster-binding protein [Streptomyces sp. Root1310]KQX65477.1 phenylacetate-CoA oxygenase [Streptomyces sp. Root1310]
MRTRPNPVLAPDGTRRRTGWHRLPVTAVQHLTGDAVAVTLDVPDTLRATFAHRPGEHVVVRHRRSGEELRRSYSVCPPPEEPGALRLVIKRGAPDGFGAYALTRLAPGDRLELSAPAGAFALPELPGAHHVLIAGGSGITPLAAMGASALRTDPTCRVHLVHSVPTAADALLADELALLKDAFVDRFTVLHLLTREGRPPLDGRIDAERLPRLLAALDVRPGPDTTFALCGPAGLIATVRRALKDAGADPALVRSELFALGDTPPLPPVPSTPPVPGAVPGAPRTLEGTRVTALYDGHRRVVTAGPRDPALLDALLRDHPDVPYACREGICGSCRAKVLTGEVATGPQYALDAGQLAAGYTLTCRARPLGGEVTVDFDA